MREKEEMVRLALPKGRMQDGVIKLLSQAGLELKAGERDYRPRLPLEGFDVKMLKPQNIVEMLDVGSRDIGFAGADWVAELNLQLVPLMDTALDPVRIVAAAPQELLVDGKLPDSLPDGRKLLVAGEYENLARRWIAARKLDACFVRTYGATEVFPPEDADCIIDNTASGATLKANDLVIVDELMRSSTRLYASRQAMDNPLRRNRIELFIMLCQSVLSARSRVMLELNVEAGKLDALLAILPAMKEPTVSPLRGDSGYAVKIAAPRAGLSQLIPAILERGGSAIVITEPSRIIA
ncbi:MAG: ATP phosphoribosyltransferase [Spirochaetes bacterium]|nr:ATP phosphoribosyltransferase [Spirochaetota bacterium]MBU0956998.1 ATP phosphoribosyltransferase [Spirochaetota bacterium]